MRIKTADLIGPALDWAVAKCEGAENLRINPHRFDQRLIAQIAGRTVLMSALRYDSADPGPHDVRQALMKREARKSRPFRAFDAEWADIKLVTPKRVREWAKKEAARLRRMKPNAGVTGAELAKRPR